MNIISRIQFTNTPDASDLYMKYSEGASLKFCEEYAEITLTKNGVLSFNTYFNSFYETFYAKYTELESLYYLLKLEGDFQVSLYREHYEQENRELIHKENFENCQLQEQIKILLPDSWRSEDAGRVYLEIMCLSERGSFAEGCIATAQNPVREVSLGIISCTFKKEAYIKKTVDAILKDDFLQDKKLKIFVVDNGKTLNKDEFPEQQVELILNRNVGGSGGFTRGLIQALQEDVFTHFLFMDDDILLETESIYRLFPLYEYAKQDFAVAGSMFDLYKKHILYEAGALYAKCFDGDGDYMYNPFTIAPLKNNLNLENTANTNLLLSEENPDYGAFWFFAFSRKAVDEIGLPMPFFIKLDDIDFSLRIKEHFGSPIVPFPGIAVWHEPFYGKNPVWDNYYIIRNHLITHSMRNSLNYMDAVKFLTKSLLHKLFIFDYNSAEMLLKGFEDYMKGPLLMESSDPEMLHASIVGLSKSHKSQSIQSNSLLKSEPPNNSGAKKTKDPAFKKLLGLLTLNGHLLPSFLLSKDDAILWITSDNMEWWPKVFTKKRVLIFREGNNSISQNEMSRPVGIGIFIKWLQIILKGGIRWSSVSSEWRNAVKLLTSTEFWTKYLKLNEQSS
ncbi:MAG: glycosyltransferase [Brasilonema angustatum HA4187-MV1]|jgi:galactofuranosylgalactofuranosylrhamnosyl-N-acetylglucosaminyl-diphospho-decaprenol beta-1,5/1,6-galactofuranosyltransferase|nr:glycosyltransferase [Brasilonema angustatum HA4187-MV1]